MKLIIIFLLGLSTQFAMATDLISDLKDYIETKRKDIAYAKEIVNYYDKKLIVVEVSKNKVKRDFILSQMIQKANSLKKNLPKSFQAQINNEIKTLNRLRLPIPQNERHMLCWSLRLKIDEVKDYIQHL